MMYSDYCGESGVKRRSTSQSRVKDLVDEDFEEIKEADYEYSVKEWTKLIKTGKHPEGSELERMEYSIKIGLPPSIRGEIWEFIVKVEKYKSKSPLMYLNYLESPNSKDVDFTISKDILRTFPREELYKEDWKSGTNKLFNVLKAYAAYDKKVKY